MRAILTDLVRQTSSLFTQVKIAGTDTTTSFQAVDGDKAVFLQATLGSPQPEMLGDFGIGNLALLDGLLNFPSYKADDASFSVRREEKNGAETVTAFVFRDANGTGAMYRTMDAKLVTEQATIKNIPWTVTVVPSKSKIAEFSQLSKLYSEVEKAFRVTTKDADLVFSLGNENSTSAHTANMVFESGVTGELSGDLVFDTGHFLTLMKVAGANPTTLSVTNKGVLGVTVQTPLATYNYYVRAMRG